MKRNKKIKYLFTEQEMDKMFDQETKCRVNVEKFYNTQAYSFFCCYDVKTKEMFRILVVGKANDTEDYISEYFHSVASSVKYHNQVKSCQAQAMGIEFVDIRDLQKKGFIVVEVHEDGTFVEINSTDLLLAYNTFYKCTTEATEVFIWEANELPLVPMGDYVLSILENEFNIPTYADINAVSKTISTFMDFNARSIGILMEYLDKQCGNVAFRVDNRIHYYYPGNGVTADFRGFDYDSATSCEFDTMVGFEGGSEECLSIACAINNLGKAEKACIHTIIDTMLKTPGSELNDIYTSLIINVWRNNKARFSDRYAIINGPAVEFVKCGKAKAGSVEIITSSL